MWSIHRAHQTALAQQSSSKGRLIDIVGMRKDMKVKYVLRMLDVDFTEENGLVRHRGKCGKNTSSTRLKRLICMRLHAQKDCKKSGRRVEDVYVQNVEVVDEMQLRESDGMHIQRWYTCVFR